MESKESFIRNLPKKKIVIGNGFDLHCGLKTRYVDFFSDFWKRNKKIEDLIDTCLDQQEDIKPLLDASSKISVWDIYFYLLSKPSMEMKHEKWNWCDVESTITASLSKSSTNDSRLKNFPRWALIFQGVSNHCDNLKMSKNGYFVDLTEHERKSLSLLIRYCFAANEQKKNNYIWLFDELKKFEIHFGGYIKEQVKENLEDYKKKTRKFFRLFNDSESPTITSVDSFNYSDLNGGIQNKLHHINGDTDHPIFGIDSKKGLDDNSLRFSKTSRRMELDMIQNEYDENAPFENIVIYGHSLCEADYSYFFSIFDKVKIYDTEANSIIVFAYSIPKECSEIKAKNDSINGICNLFKGYAIYKGYKDQPYRMLDFLTTQRRVILYEI